MNGLYFYSHCVGFLFNKKKMSDYYGEYLFSSPTGAFLISMREHNDNSAVHSVFVPYRGISNLNRLYISMNNFESKVFVPYRGISNLNYV